MLFDPLPKDTPSVVPSWLCCSDRKRHVNLYLDTVQRLSCMISLMKSKGRENPSFLSDIFMIHFSVTSTACCCFRECLPDSTTCCCLQECLLTCPFRRLLQDLQLLWPPHYRCFPILSHVQSPVLLLVKDLDLFFTPSIYSAGGIITPGLPFLAQQLEAV